MLTLRRSRSNEGAGDETTGFEFTGTDDALAQEIERLAEANRQRYQRERSRSLLRLRNLLGVRRVQATDRATPRRLEPDESSLPRTDAVPEIAPDILSPALLRAAILRHGCLLVRGLVAHELATGFARKIDRSFAARDRHDAGQRYDRDLYEPFDPDPRLGVEPGRHWIKSGGGVLASDSPMLSLEMFEMFRQVHLPELVHGYLGEPPLITVHKTTLRRAEPAVAGAWHQDGKFMGDVRALNLWLSLSHCGDESPGLDLVPRRLDGYAQTQTDEAWLEHAVSQRVAEELAGERSILRPIFEPGDALLFDELFLHKTASDASMTKPRFAIENWFFAPSGFPTDYAPLSV